VERSGGRPPSQTLFNHNRNGLSGSNNNNIRLQSGLGEVATTGAAAAAVLNPKECIKAQKKAVQKIEATFSNWIILSITTSN